MTWTRDLEEGGGPPRRHMNEFFRMFGARNAPAAPQGTGNPVIDDLFERLLLLNGRTAARALPRNAKIDSLGDAEFRVFSQWGEDGIIEWLISHVAAPNERFVEFGVESFEEANCRFLMQNRNWRGLVLDSSADHMARLRSSVGIWRYDLTAVTAFITAENINGLISGAGFAGPLGILSIDVDGNDYWIWKAIDCVAPAIVICEYNSLLGDTKPLTIPYDPEFERFKAHSSGLFFGASIVALQQLARTKGYSFVGTNTNGNNAFFVRDDLAATVISLLAERKARPTRHRGNRDEEGRLAYVAGPARFQLIKDCSVFDLESGRSVRLSDIEGLYSDHWVAGMT